MWEMAFMEAFVDIAVKNKATLDRDGWGPIVYDFKSLCEEIIKG